MSYEGSIDNLCNNGHLWTVEVFASNEDDPCPVCHEEAAWCNTIDNTNGDAFGVIPPAEWAKWRLTSPEVETCNLGHKHTTKPETYRIPSEEEHKAARHYYDEERGAYVPISFLKDE